MHELPPIGNVAFIYATRPMRDDFLELAFSIHFQSDNPDTAIEFVKRLVVNFLKKTHPTSMPRLKGIDGAPVVLYATALTKVGGHVHNETPKRSHNCVVGADGIFTLGNNAANALADELNQRLGQNVSLHCGKPHRP